jgi:hypothetical protein
VINIRLVRFVRFNFEGFVAVRSAEGTRAI